MTVLDALVTTACLYSAGLLTCLTTCGMYVATTPDITRFNPRGIGVRPGVLVALAVVGCSTVWPVTAALVAGDRLRRNLP
ncbi:hypothetical protein ACFQ08_04045 [Streptosporangium algeriense]|uniref:Uncharacterized protein n=1 Tax=Streptosporangium algeriense TaxID=1682748 RepID=A0ABW3DL64_9ACTN